MLLAVEGADFFLEPVSASRLPLHYFMRILLSQYI